MFLRSAKIKQSDFLRNGSAHAPPECVSALVWQGDQGWDARAEMRLHRHAHAELPCRSHRIAKKRFAQFLHSGLGNRLAGITPEPDPNGN